MPVKAAGYIFLGLLAAFSPINAQSEKTFSLTISPIHLAFPVVELTGEMAVSPKLGIAGIGGFGSITAENNLGEKKSIPVLELGGQAAYYVVGSFRHGMQVGAEAMWLKVFIPEKEGVSVSTNGLAIGPLLGYKWAARFGLTFLVQGGYQWLFAQAKGTDAAGNEIEASQDSGIPLLNLNAGWSF